MSTRERFGVLAELTTIFTWSGTADGHLEFCNEAWLAFRGRTLEQELGLGWMEGVHPDEVQRVRALALEAYRRELPFDHEYRILDATGRYRWILDRGEPRRDADGTVIGYHGTALSIDDRVRAEQATSILSEVGRLAAAAEHPTDALEEIARATIPWLGDVCVIDLLDGKGGLDRAVLAHRDPEREKVARRLAGPQQHSPLFDVLRAGQAVLLRHDAETFADAGAPEDRESRLGFALRSSIVAPISARGHDHGVMTFGSHEPDFHEGTDDLALAEEVARRVALALDHAASLQAAVAARETGEATRVDLQTALDRASLLADISGVLESSLTLDPTLDHVAELVAGRLADAVAIDVVDLAGRTARRGAASVLPHLLDPAREAARDGRRLLTLPLARSERALGAMTFVWRPGRGPRSGDLVLLDEIARRVALAVDAALLFADRAQAARTLQESLLPERLPRIPDVALAVRYLPAAGGEVSGDFYDVFALPDGTWLLVVGDVCGKGVEAAALTAQARYTVRALAPWLIDPAAVLIGLNASLRQQRDDDRFVTLAILRLDPRDGTLTHSTAGHPAPFVLRADGVEVLEHTGPVVGVLDEIEPEQGRTTLAPGDVVAIFTDGITEASRSAVRGSAGLAQDVLSARSGGPHGVTRALEEIARLAAAGAPRDDVAILAAALDPRR